MHVKLGVADGHVGPLVCVKFHLSRCRAVGIGPPKYQKFPLFGKESPRVGKSFDRFLQFSWAFYIRPSIPLVFQI